MKAVLLLIVLAGCSGWPDESYVAEGSDAAANILAPAIAECIKALVPEHTQIKISLSHSAMTLDGQVFDLTQAWSSPEQNGHYVSNLAGEYVTYIVAPTDGGTFISVAAPPTGRCAQYFSRVAGSLAPAGSMTVSH